jgi:phosphatidate cytidylyltransferase
VLIHRVLSAIVLLPIVLGAAYLGGPYFATVVGVAALLAGYEFYRIMRTAGYEPSYLAGLSLIAVLMLDAYYPNHEIWRWGVAGAVILLMVWQILRTDAQGFLVDWALTLVGALYVAVLLGHMIALRNLPQGLGWLLLTFAATWTCDTAAYFAGNWWGKHGFFSRVSPHKTREGAIAGMLLGTLATLVAGHWVGLLFWQSAALGVLLVLGITFGDLAESLLKRQVGVKDSGALIPGHGGMLDRIDSLLFAGVIAYYFVVWVVR